MRHFYLACHFNFKSLYADVSAVGPVSGVHALVFTHALAGTHVLACVSEVVGLSVAGVVAL